MHVSRGMVLFICTFVLLITSAGITSFALFLPFIETEFGWSRSMVTVPYTVAMVVWGISAPLFGKLADDHGARPVMLWGVALMATGFVVMGLAQDLWQISLAFGVLVGAAKGAASITIAALLISKHYDGSSRARAVSVVQTASPLNPLLFAPILFLLMSRFDWRTAALVTGGLLWVVALPLAWIGARDPDPGKLAGRPRLGWSAAVPYLRDRTMLLMFLARVACGLAFFQQAHLVAITLSKGFSTGTGAAAVSIMGFSAVVFALLFGWLADRYSRVRMLSLSYLVRGVFTLLMAVWVPDELVFFLLVALAVGPTFATIAVQNVWFYETVGPRLAGLMLGLSFIIHQVGSAVGPQLGSLIFDITQTYDGYQLAIGLVLLFSAAITFNLKDIGRDAGRGADVRLPEPRLTPAPTRA
jgi:MFS family permease